MAKRALWTIQREQKMAEWAPQTLQWSQKTFCTSRQKEVLAMLSRAPNRQKEVLARLSWEPRSAGLAHLSHQQEQMQGQWVWGPLAV